MPKVIEKLDDEHHMKTGAFHVPNRKKPVLGIEKDGKLAVYGSFIDDATADEFMDRLAFEMLNATRAEEDNDDDEP